MYKNPAFEAEKNAIWLRENSYSGRGIVLGVTTFRRHRVLACWIGGRSGNSQNRVFSVQDSRLFTEAADPALVSDPSLIIYKAMDELDDYYVVSNGHQTDDVVHSLRRSKDLVTALKNYEYEPDSPNFTPRITGVCLNGSFAYRFGLAILRRSLWDDSCDKAIYYYRNIEPGFGFCITTYEGNGDPLPAFRSEPLLMPLEGDIEAVARTYWQMLNPVTRVALAVKFIDVETGDSEIRVINRFTKV